VSSAIRQLALARWRSFYREPGTIFWAFGFPIVLAIVLGTAFRNQKPEPVAIAVEAIGAESEVEHVRAILGASPDVKVSVLPEGVAEDALRTGKVSVLVIPSPERTYRFDPTRPESRLARAIADDVLQRGEGRKDAIATRSELVSAPGSRYIDFLIPGLIGMNLMSSGLWGIGFSLGEMRTRKLLKRLVATPMKKSEFLLAFLVVRACLLVVELPPLLAFAWLAFDVGIRGSILTLGLVALAGAIVFAVIGLLVASRAENPQVVSGLINVVSFPMYLCSGVFFPSSKFPDWLQPALHALPLTALIDAMRAVMIDGASFAAIGTKLAVLLLWGVGAFALAMRLFKWR
jgi:ABC transporter DrrB family efflux protein